MRSGQSECRVPPAPIRTPERSSCLGGQMRILFTQLRVTPEHERHLVTSLRRLYFPASLICLWPLHHFDLVDRDKVVGLFVDQAGSLQYHVTQRMGGLLNHIDDATLLPTNRFFLARLRACTCWVISSLSKCVSGSFPGIHRCLECSMIHLNVLTFSV